MLSAPLKKGGRSSMSYQSGSDGANSGGEASFCSWGSGEGLLMCAVGAQFAQGEEGGWPMSMSGVSGLSGE